MALVERTVKNNMRDNPGLPGRVVLSARRPKTMQQCLMTLGAARGDVCVRRKYYETPVRSIYRKYTLDEIHYMAGELYRDAIRKYHVDLHHSHRDRDLYEEKTKRLNEAHQNVLRLLGHRDWRP